MLGKGTRHGSPIGQQKSNRSPGALSSVYLSRLSGDQGQIRHRSRHQGLEQGLCAAEVARLARIVQPGVRQAHALIFCKAGALLQSSGLLQQPLLRVQAHRSALAWPSSNAGWAESALAAPHGVETEGLLNAASPLAIWPSSDRRQLVSDLPGGTAAGHGFQVDGEGFLGEAVPIGLKRDPGDQPATRLLELLPGS